MGVNKEDQKKTNRGLVLKLVATGECDTRIELAKVTGLSKTAISQIVNRLIEKNLLVDGEKDTSAEPGRNPVRLSISPQAPYFAGVLINRGILWGVICDIRMNIIKEKTIRRRWQSNEELISDLYDLMDEIMEGQTHVMAMGVSAIGPVSVKEGVILKPMYFEGVGNIRVRDLLSERYQLPVYFDHDNQNAVLVEHLYGNGRGYEDILLVSVGEGIGCGLLVDGKRIHSYTGYAPEIGHISIDYHGIPCACGNIGCLERYVNSKDMLNKLRYVTGMNLPYEELCRIGQNKAQDMVMQEAAHKLAIGILNLLNVMNSQIVLLGYDCVYWPDKYLRQMEDEINSRKFGNRDIHIPVKKTKYLYRAQVLGAAANAVSHELYGE